MKVSLTLEDGSEVVLNRVVFSGDTITGTTSIGEMIVRRSLVVRQRLLADEHGRPVGRR
jgi:hypothetical protein